VLLMMTWASSSLEQQKHLGKLVLEQQDAEEVAL
jgi:hypothetical protein